VCTLPFISVTVKLGAVIAIALITNIAINNRKALFIKTPLKTLNYLTDIGIVCTKPFWTILMRYTPDAKFAEENLI
jgi:hypothetical protein